MTDLWKYIVDLEETHDVIMKSLKHVLNNNGGFLWPILSMFLFAYAWSNLILLWKIFVAIVWTILFIIAILTPIVQAKENRAQNEWLENEAKRLRCETESRVNDVVGECNKKMHEYLETVHKVESKLNVGKALAQDLYGIYKKLAATNPACKWPNEEPWDNFFKFIQDK